MAQLPPKIPALSTEWPNCGYQKSPSMGTFFPSAAPSPGAQPSWVDEFLDFSAAKRGAHRRTVSDSVTFLEAPAESGVDDRMVHEFDRLDDYQLLSMFSDDMLQLSSSSAAAAPVSSSNTSTPSDHNSNSGEKTGELRQRNEAEEAQSTCKVDPQPTPAATHQPAEPEQIIDPKRVKRILANRQSAQRSRVRKLQYISELERTVTALQTEVSALSPRVAFLDHQRSLLTVGNSHLKQRIAALAQDKIFKDAHREALKKELERLRQVYHQQSLHKMGAPTSDAVVPADNKLLSMDGATGRAHPHDGSP
ncbi:basic leucine zipper 61 [Phoenix dactylifera]|uniref:Basic leucine zipper 61 n=1 Tax=Phoenix dactylifera TaxID=42345 RepID=A0A8B7BRT1_PHODC|nr:basic leucine zipper 61 [Phoenix dactylifera]